MDGARHFYSFESRLELFQCEVAVFLPFTAFDSEFVVRHVNDRDRGMVSDEKQLVWCEIAVSYQLRGGFCVARCFAVELKNRVAIWVCGIRVVRICNFRGGPFCRVDHADFVRSQDVPDFLCKVLPVDIPERIDALASSKHDFISPARMPVDKLSQIKHLYIQAIN